MLDDARHRCPEEQTAAGAGAEAGAGAGAEAIADGTKVLSRGHRMNGN